ncbi:MAG: hypothetical protein QW622_03700 [Candidatus Pacearchaeota archaeon]
MEYPIICFDIFNKKKINLFDFFINSLKEPLYNSYKREEIKLLPAFKNGKEGYIAAYLAGTLTQFVFYEEHAKKIKKLQEIVKENESKGIRNLFYDFLLLKNQGEELLLNEGLFKKGYCSYLGSRFYFQASQLKMKLDHKVSILSLILRNISFYFEEFSRILNETIKL